MIKSNFSIDSFSTENEKIKKESMSRIVGGDPGDIISKHSTIANADGNTDCADIVEGSKPGTTRVIIH